uniref:CS domain-containing protein n=1 Tax=Haptolina brevifila TaxID=156173 RepID=A0A7S2IG75_9EUKA|mmetsp:Transcript_65785/g.130359  ORF Transcript_65785/g.130359 Transcript_65785/m.130359 type:complete len:338 (+) Transcript_65785:47-1060(+)
MPLFEEDQDNICEGCMVHNTGDNFTGPAFCKACMNAMMDVPVDDVLKGQDKVTDHLAKNADSKIGALTTWKDTDGQEVEIMLPLPQGAHKSELVVKVTPTKLLVRAGDRKLLFIDPLFDRIDASATIWCLEYAKDGSVQMQLSLSKILIGTRWGRSLCKEGGYFEYWGNSLLEEPGAKEARLAGGIDGTVPKTTLPWEEEEDAVTVTIDGIQKPAPKESLTKAGKLKPRFTMRDDGAEVEINLPLPPTIQDKKALKVTATVDTIEVFALEGSSKKSLMYVKPLLGDIEPDELMWTIEKSKDGQQHCQLTLVKKDESVEWLTNICKKDGTFTCWTTEL